MAGSKDPAGGYLHLRLQTSLMTPSWSTWVIPRWSLGHGPRSLLPRCPCRNWWIYPQPFHSCCQPSRDWSWLLGLLLPHLPHACCFPDTAPQPWSWPGRGPVILALNMHLYQLVLPPPGPEATVDSFLSFVGGPPPPQPQQMTPVSMVQTTFSYPHAWMDAISTPRSKDSYQWPPGQPLWRDSHKHSSYKSRQSSSSKGQSSSKDKKLSQSNFCSGGGE